MCIRDSSYPGLTEEELAQVNILRDRFAGEMADTVSVLGRKGATVEEITKAVYELMVRREIQLRLKEYEEQFKASGNMDLAKEYSQAVSYTHLDVYKRQRGKCARGPAAVRFARIMLLTYF